MDIVLLMITLSISTYLVSSIYYRYKNREILPNLIVLCFLWQTIGICVAYAFYYSSLYTMLNYPHWLNLFFVGILGISVAAFLTFLIRNGISRETAYKTLALSSSVFLILYLVYASYVPVVVVLGFNILIFTVSLVIIYLKRDHRQSYLSFSQIGVGIITFSISIVLKGVFTQEYVTGIANGSIFIIAMGSMLYYLEHTTFHMKDINCSLVAERDISEGLRKKYEMVLENVREGIWEYDLENDRVFLSGMLREFFGVTECMENAFETLLKHVHPEDARFFSEQISGITHEDLVYHLMRNAPSITGKEYRFFSQVESRYVWVNFKATRVLDPKKFTVRLYGTITVIQDAREAEERIYQLAYYDQISGLRNATSFHEHLEKIQQRESEENVFFLIDLDRFKYINDSRGHRFGDEVIRQIARSLINLQISGCDAFRLGGTEFLLVTSQKNFDRISDGLSQIFSTAIEINDSSIHLTASIGYSFFNPQATSSERLMIQLDLAKHRAKDLGGNCQVEYLDAFSEELEENVMLSEALRSGIRKKELSMHYQPKVCMDTGVISGYEALLRWNLNGKWIPPDKIIRIAEETGQIHALGKLIIEMVFEESGFAEDHQSIAINLSVMQLEYAGFLSEIDLLQDTYQMDSSRFIFEITENVLMQGVEEIISTLNQLRVRGYRVALDDFGTGYASYTYLSRLPINELKLDRSLTQSIIAFEKDAAIVRHMIDIGKVLGFTVVCEGIETFEEYAALKSYGCDIGQGYYFSKPLPSSRFLKMS